MNAQPLNTVKKEAAGTQPWLFAQQSGKHPDAS